MRFVALNFSRKIQNFEKFSRDDKKDWDNFTIFSGYFLCFGSFDSFFKFSKSIDSDRNS